MKPASLIVGVIALGAIAGGVYDYTRDRVVVGPVLSFLGLAEKPKPATPPGTATGPQPPSAGGPPRGLPPAPVTVAPARVMAVPITIGAIGNAQPFTTVQVKAQIEGLVTDVHFKDGDSVKKGDLLFTLDPRPFEALLRQAEANLAKDKALLVRAKADLARFESLVERDFASRARYEEAKANVAALEATVLADEALVEQARIRLGYTKIHAPMDARAGAVLVSAGNLVKANETAMVVLNQVRPIYIAFSVPEARIDEVRRRMAAGAVKATAFLPGEDGPVAEGALSFIDNNVDRTTGTIQLRATFENADGRLVPGQFANVVVRLATLDGAIVVPSAAIQTGQRGTFVFVVKDDMTAEVRPVTVGIVFDGGSVVTGVKAGERVVTVGQLRLRPGARVVIDGGGRPGAPPGAPPGNRPPAPGPEGGPPGPPPGQGQGQGQSQGSNR
jgi:membrane fusion protein, multidrug efflux system